MQERNQKGDLRLARDLIPELGTATLLSPTRSGQSTSTISPPLIWNIDSVVEIKERKGALRRLIYTTGLALLVVYRLPHFVIVVPGASLPDI